VNFDLLPSEPTPFIRGFSEFGMLGRAELAFVVMDIGYVHNNIFTDEVFYTLMFAAFSLNILVPLCIKFWTPHFNASRKNK